MTKAVHDFIHSLPNKHRDIVAALGVTERAVFVWQTKNSIPAKYHAALEQLARDKKCFGKYKRAALARGVK